MFFFMLLCFTVCKDIFCLFVLFGQNCSLFPSYRLCVPPCVFATCTCFPFPNSHLSPPLCVSVRLFALCSSSFPEQVISPHSPCMSPLAFTTSVHHFYASLKIVSPFY